MAQLLNRLRAEERVAGVEFWHSPERGGWLMKQGEFIKTWRRRWFILKQGKIFWFKTDEVGPVRKHFPASLLRVWMQTYLSSPTHLTDLYP